MAGNQVMIDMGYRRIMNNIDGMNDLYTEIGFPGGTEYSGAGSLDAAGLATLHELGTVDKGGYIPARPANRMAFDRYIEDIQKRAKSLYNQVLSGLPNVIAIKRLGVWYEGKLWLAYMQGPFTPNAESTIARKGSSRPLVDTKKLVNAITSKAFRKGAQL